MLTPTSVASMELGHQDWPWVQPLFTLGAEIRKNEGLLWRCTSVKETRILGCEYSSVIESAFIPPVTLRHLIFICRNFLETKSFKLKLLLYFALLSAVYPLMMPKWKRMRWLISPASPFPLGGLCAVSVRYLMEVIHNSRAQAFLSGPTHMTLLEASPGPKQQFSLYETPQTPG